MIARRIPTELMKSSPSPEPTMRELMMLKMQVGRTLDENGQRCVTVALADVGGDAHMVALLIPDAGNLARAILAAIDAWSIDAGSIRSLPPAKNTQKKPERSRKRVK